MTTKKCGPLEASWWRKVGADYEQQDGRGRLQRRSGGWALYVDGRFRGSWRLLRTAKDQASKMTAGDPADPEGLPSSAGPPRPARPNCELRVGDGIYHVVEDDLPDDGRIHTWKLQIDRVSNTRLDGFVLGRVVGWSKIHKWHTLGTKYFRTPDSAVRAFLVEQLRKGESARRTLAELERANDWGNSRLVELTADLGRLEPAPAVETPEALEASPRDRRRRSRA